MRNSLLVFSVGVLSSGIASAAEIDSLNGVTIGLNGEVDLQYYKSQDKSVHSEWNVNEANFGFQMTYEMTEDLTMGAHLDIDANNGNDNSVTRGNVYGIININQAHTITFGDQETILDDAGIGNDYEFGFTSYFDNMETDGDQVIKYKYDGGEVFYGGVSYLEHRNTDTSSSGYYSDDYQADFNFGARVGDSDFGVFVARSQKLDLDEDTYVFEARHRYGDWNFAATYGVTNTQQDSSASDKKQDIYGMTLSYFTGGRFEYAAGWATTSTSNSTTASENIDVNDFYANVTYIFTDEVSAYAEVGLTDEDDAETGYVVGLEATF